MKGYELRDEHVTDILISKMGGETDESIGKRYSVTAKTIGNWLREERFIDRKQELVVGLRSMTRAGRFVCGEIAMNFNQPVDTGE